jgi:hypothetical protein
MVQQNISRKVQKGNHSRTPEPLCGTPFSAPGIRLGSTAEAPHIPSRRRHSMTPPSDRSGRDANTITPQQSPEKREESLDKTIEESFPASDPPSTDPAPKKDSEAA